ncbi:FecR family protein [Butyricimonas paravirosa]|uniref:FecR family protein n=1 Tax=Butyricimonas paravirosa TaxID=1472417 RepID=UPI0022E1D0DA|nr:FecR domain-containing protein [Butyricimonas paravirosa]
MKETKRYIQIQTIAHQLCDIMQQHELKDIEELKEWLEHNNTAIEIIKSLIDDSELSKKIELYRQQDKEQAILSLRTKIQKHQRHRVIIRISRVAAVIVLLIGCGLLYHKLSQQEKHQTLASTISSKLSPVIITPNGQHYDLSKVLTDTTHNLNIAYKSTEEIKYTYQPPAVDIEEEGYNQLIIPNQCNYQVTLCDGSVVRLNAGSRLEYPNSFPSHERKVRLTGEAYFEIKHDGRPFMVEVRQASIRVYGTHFNINAYQETNIETVLVEGKVGVSIQDSIDQEKILKPNQLSRLNLLTGEQEIVDVDVQKYIAWTTGFLRYDNDSLELLIEDLSRWYGADFDFKDNKLKNIRISASINKDTPLEEVLAMIQTTAKIKFHLIERRYIITQ